MRNRFSSNAHDKTEQLAPTSSRSLSSSEVLVTPRQSNTSQTQTLTSNDQPTTAPAVFDVSRFDIYHSSEISAQRFIGGYSSDGFRIGDLFFGTPLVMFPKNIFEWKVKKFADLTPEHFAVLDIIKPPTSKRERETKDKD
jgi:hypothetical protein